MNPTLKTSKAKDASVLYTEVVIPTSRKEQLNQILQQFDENIQQKKAASLKVCHVFTSSILKSTCVLVCIVLVFSI